METPSVVNRAIPAEYLRLCSICNQEKFSVEFSKAQQKKQSGSGKCKDCVTKEEAAVAEAKQKLVEKTEDVLAPNKHQPSERQQEEILPVPIHDKDKQQPAKKTEEETVELKSFTCSLCERALARSDYSKSQFSYGPKMKCKDCVAIATTSNGDVDDSSNRASTTNEGAKEPVELSTTRKKAERKEATLTCHQCEISFPLSEFSMKQLKKGTDAKCKKCIALNELVEQQKSPASLTGANKHQPVSPFIPSHQSAVVSSPTMAINTGVPHQVTGNPSSIQPVVIPITLTMPQSPFILLPPTPIPPSNPEPARTDTGDIVAISKLQRENESLKQALQTVKADTKQQIKELRESVRKYKDEVSKLQSMLDRQHQLSLLRDLTYLYKSYVFPSLIADEEWPAFVKRVMHEVAVIEDTPIQEVGEAGEVEDHSTEREEPMLALEQRYIEIFGFNVIELIKIDHPSASVGSFYHLISVKNQKECIRKCVEMKFDDELRGFVDVMISQLTKESMLHALTI